MALDDSVETHGEQLVMGSLRRQANIDSCTMKALASSLPAEFSRLEDTMSAELLSLRMEIARLSVHRDTGGDGHGDGHRSSVRASEFAHNEWASMSRLGTHLNPRAAAKSAANP